MTTYHHRYAARVIVGCAALILGVVIALALIPLAIKDCSSGSLCFELAKGAPAAFVALVIGLLAAGIAWRQHKTAQAKLKLDLFERRFAIFHRTWGFLSEIVQKGPGQLQNDYTNLIPEARFLFGVDVANYLDRVTTRRTEYWVIQQRTKSNMDVMRQEDIAKELELSQWFYEEASNGVKAVFAPYLDFSPWR